VNLHGDRQRAERRFPIGRARDHPEMRGLSGAVNAAIREQIRRELLRGERVFDATGIEAGQVQPPIARIADRHE
jgi:hypothetical protein